MAKENKNMVMFFNLVLMLSFLLFISMAEARLFGFGFRKQDSTPTCASVHGVEAGDTCILVTENFNLSSNFFSAINPNLNCDKLFVGQWLCVSGAV